MITVNTNAEMLADYINFSADQQRRYEELGGDLRAGARSIAEDADLYSVANDLFFASPEIEYASESSFRAWNGGRIDQFKQRYGGLLAYEDDAELENVKKLDAAMDEYLSGQIEAEIESLRLAL